MSLSSPLASFIALPSLRQLLALPPRRLVPKASVLLVPILFCVMLLKKRFEIKNETNAISACRNDVELIFVSGIKTELDARFNISSEHHAGQDTGRVRGVLHTAAGEGMRTSVKC